MYALETYFELVIKLVHWRIFTLNRSRPFKVETSLIVVMRERIAILLCKDVSTRTKLTS